MRLPSRHSDVMDRRLYMVFAVLLVILVIGQGMVGSPRPLTIQEVWSGLFGR